MVVGPLGRLDVLGLADPGLQRRCLERTAVGERELPRVRPLRVHRVQVRGRVLVGLASGQEDDSGHGRGHVTIQALERRVRDVVDRRTIGSFVAREDHVRLQQAPTELDPLVVQLRVERLEHALRIRHSQSPTDAEWHVLPEAPVVEATTHTGDFHADPLPFWYLDAVVALLGDPGAPDRVMAYLRDHLADAPSVATLLDMRPPNVGAVDTVAASRDRRIIVGAAGVALTLFLVEREGPRVVGKLGDVFLAGGTARDVVNQARRVPQNDRELERIWRTWVHEEYGR